MFGLLPPSSSAAIRWYSSAIFHTSSLVRGLSVLRALKAHISAISIISASVIGIRRSRRCNLRYLSEHREFGRVRPAPQRCRTAGPAQATRDPAGGFARLRNLRTPLKLRGRAHRPKK